MIPSWSTCDRERLAKPDTSEKLLCQFEEKSCLERILKLQRPDDFCRISGYIRLGEFCVGFHRVTVNRQLEELIFPSLSFFPLFLNSLFCLLTICTHWFSYTGFNLSTSTTGYCDIPVESFLQSDMRTLYFFRFKRTAMIILP